MNMDLLQITPRSGSRLLDDFDDIEEIGRGAYGHVVKARGKVDGKVFAIKKVRIDDYQVGNMNVLREVLIHAQLNHENVVRYFDSWIEECIDGENDGDYDEDTNDEEDTNGEDTNVEDTNVEDDGDGVEIMFRNSASSSGSKISGSAIGSSKPGKGNFASGLMCMKMEYCELGTMRTTIDRGIFCDKERSWRFLREILNGLAYIHREHIIHRDLNPCNIFIDGNGSAKIGDFGSATFEIRTGDSSNTNTLSSIPCDFRRQISHLSGKVGTALYAAPEVEQSMSETEYTYDTRADMYSLGFIVFEMIYPPIQTFMEKSKIFDSLKKQSYPDSFSKSEYLYQVHIVDNLLSVDPQSRNTASDLLNPENRLLPCEQVEERHLQDEKIAVRVPTFVLVNGKRTIYIKFFYS